MWLVLPGHCQSGELRSLLCDSVSHHLVSDVPVGIFLSAGIDSNVVAALASELSPNLQSITLAFDEYAGTDNDEAPLAEAAARALGCEHTTYRIGRSEFESLIDDFFDCMDQPTIDGLNTYLVSYAAAKLGLKVALSGLGGDELFGGYPSFRDVPQVSAMGPAPFQLATFWQCGSARPTNDCLAGHASQVAGAFYPFDLSGERLSTAPCPLS